MNAERVAHDPGYINFAQQNDQCCVVACVQMIMYRRGISLLSQGAMSKDLNTGMPRSDRFAREGIRIGRPYGTKTATVLNPFFRRRNIELKVRTVNPNRLHDPAQFIQRNIQLGNDIIASYDMAVLDDAKSSFHAVLINELNGEQVHCVDPYIGHREIWEVSISDLMYAMDGADNKIFVIHTRTEESRKSFQVALDATRR